MEERVPYMVVNTPASEGRRRCHLLPYESEEFCFFSVTERRSIRLNDETLCAEVGRWAHFEEGRTEYDSLSFGPDNAWKRPFYFCFFEPYYENDTSVLILVAVANVIFRPADLRVTMPLIASFVVHPFLRGKRIGRRFLSGIVYWFLLPLFSMRGFILVASVDSVPFWAKQGFRLVRAATLKEQWLDDFNRDFLQTMLPTTPENMRIMISTLK